MSLKKIEREMEAHNFVEKYQVITDKWGDLFPNIDAILVRNGEEK